MDQENTLIITKTRCPRLAGGVFSKPGRELADVLKAWLGGAPVEHKEAAPRSETPIAAVEPTKNCTMNGSLKGCPNRVAASEHVLTEELAAIWKRMCSPRGVADEFTALKASIEQLAGSTGVAEFYAMLRKPACPIRVNFGARSRRGYALRTSMCCSSNCGRTCERTSPNYVPSTKLNTRPKLSPQQRQQCRRGEPMSNEIVKAQPNNCMLYELEDNLAVFANTVDLAPDEPTRQLVLDEIGQALRKAKDKRDAVVAFLRHCEQQQAFADAEIERIGKRKKFIARVQEELECYVVQVIDEFAVPDRRGVKRLEGNVWSMRIQKNPDSVTITDVAAIPLAQKDVILTMPAYVWKALLDVLGPRIAKSLNRAWRN